MKQSKRVISAILIVFMIIGQLSNVFAATIGQTVDLVSLGECGRHLKYRNSAGQDVVIITHYIVYNENGKQYTAYCPDVVLPRSR